MACSKVTILSIGLVAFAFLVGSGVSMPAEHTHHHKIPGTIHHHHHRIPGHHHHKGSGATANAGNPGNGAPGGSPIPTSGLGGVPGLGGAGGNGTIPGLGGAGGNGDLPGLNGGVGGNGGIPGLNGGVGGNGGIPGLNGGVGGNGGLPGLGGGAGYNGGGAGVQSGGLGDPVLGPTGKAAQELGYSSRPDLAGPIYGIDDLQPYRCLDTPGYNDGVVKQADRGARDVLEGAGDNVVRLAKKIVPVIDPLANGVENAANVVVCYAEKIISDDASDLDTALQYTKHGVVDAEEGIGHPSFNDGPAPVVATATAAAGVADQALKAIDSTASDFAVGVTSGAENLANTDSPSQ